MVVENVERAGTLAPLQDDIQLRSVEGRRKGRRCIDVDGVHCW